jgi:fucose 4-O-acetylase-like acetyltransferase
VILQHLAITYGGPGDWFYNEPGELSDISTILMTLFLAINQSFFMGFFFMISSYFNPGSVDRKGGGAFLIDRLKRLGIPLVIFTLLIFPLIVYPIARLNGYSGPWVSSYPFIILTWATFPLAHFGLWPCC